MFCSGCGKQIQDDSKFCQFCGIKIMVKDISIKTEENIKNTSQNDDNLWSKFWEMYWSKDSERDSFASISSKMVWDFINRISKNSFERFLEINKEFLNKQPYTTIEALESCYTYSATGGYWLWIAEAIVENKQLPPAMNVDEDAFYEKWKTAAFDEYTSYADKFSKQFSEAFENWHSYRFKSLLEAAPTIKELSNEIVEEIKLDITRQILWSYIAGLVEEKMRSA